MGNSYGVDSIGYRNYANDPAFLAALQSYNANFRGAAHTDSTAAQQAQYLQALREAAAAQDTTTTTTPVVDPTFKGGAYGSANEGSGVGTALTVAGGIAAGAATLIYASKKGNGKGIIQGFKNIYNSIKGKTTQVVAEATNSVAKNKQVAEKGLEQIKIVMDGTRPVYYVPGKTTTTADKSTIKSMLNSDRDLRRLTGLRFNTGETTINSATFTLTDNGIKNTIVFNGNKIEKILNDKGTDITSTFINGGKIRTDLDIAGTTFTSKIEDAIAKIKSGNKDIVFDSEYALENITYTTKIGDNSAKVFRKGISAYRHGQPVIQELTTLKKCNSNSNEVLAYIRKSKDEGHDISSIISDDFVRRSKLPSGYKVGEFDLKDGTNIIHILNGKPVSVTIRGKKYSSKSDDFLAFMERHEKAVDTMIANALKDNNIPKGATIIPV